MRTRPHAQYQQHLTRHFTQQFCSLSIEAVLLYSVHLCSFFMWKSMQRLNSETNVVNELAKAFPSATSSMSAKAFTLNLRVRKKVAKQRKTWWTTWMNLLPPRIPWRTRPSITHSIASQEAREFNRRSHDETWCFGELRKSSTDIPATSRRVERSCAVSCWGASGHPCKGLKTSRFKT